MSPLGRTRPLPISSFLPRTPEHPVRRPRKEVEMHDYELRSKHPFPFFDQELALRVACPFQLSEEGKVQALELPSNHPAAAYRTKTIYGIYDKRKNCWYVGRTERPLKKRIGEHRSHANVLDENNPLTSNYLGARPEFYQNLKQRPEDFCYTVIDFSHDSNYDIAEAERYYIAAAKAYSKGYNSNCGGDGSRPIRPGISKLVRDQSTRKIKRFIVKTRNAKGERSYPIRVRNGCLTLKETPGAKKKGPFVYKAELGDGVYYGSSVDSVFGRFRGHAQNKTSALFRAVHDSDVQEGTFTVLYRDEDPAAVRLAETELILSGQEQKKKLLNRTGGPLSGSASVEQSPAQSGRRFRRIHGET